MLCFITNCKPHSDLGQKCFILDYEEAYNDVPSETNPSVTGLSPMQTIHSATLTSKTSIRMSPKVSIYVHMYVRIYTYICIYMHTYIWNIPRVF